MNYLLFVTYKLNFIASKLICACVIDLILAAWTFMIKDLHDGSSARSVDDKERDNKLTTTSYRFKELGKV